MNRFITPAELGEHRADAESRMGAANLGSDAVVRRTTGRKVQNEDTGREEPEWAVTHSALAGRLGSSRGAGSSRTVQTPAGEVQVAVRVWSCPASTGGLYDGDLIEITAGERAGTVWRIVDAEGADQQTARRVAVTQVDRPQEWP